MAARDTATATATAILLHWLMAVLLLGQFVFGLLLRMWPPRTGRHAAYPTPTSEIR